MAIFLAFVIGSAKVLGIEIQPVRALRFSALVFVVTCALVLPGCGDDEGNTLVIVDGDLSDDQRKEYCKSETKVEVGLVGEPEIIFTDNPRSPCGVVIEEEVDVQYMELHLHSRNADAAFLVNDFANMTFQAGFESLVVDVEGVSQKLFVRPGQSCTVLIQRTPEGDSEDYINTGTACNLFLYRENKPSIEFTLRRSN